MREVLFRGKCKRNAWSDGGQWLYGDYLRCGNGAQIWVHEDGDENNYEVVPETVGQWTGLTDRNGVRIFEGDFVTCLTIVQETNEFVTSKPMPIVWDTASAGFAFVWPDGTVDTLEDVHWTVVGNVYDNPELLEA